MTHEEVSTVRYLESETFYKSTGLRRKRKAKGREGKGKEGKGREGERRGNTENNTVL